MLMVAAELQSGCALLPQIDPMYGPDNSSEAELIEKGAFHQSYSLRWQPSAKDRKNNPNLPSDAALDVVIHEVELQNGTFLYLVSTLEMDATSTAELYSRRYDVEFDIRDLKVTMDAENILAKSVVMVKKELMTSVVAYNLIMQFRRQAAKLVRVEPRRLSFKGVWLSFRDHLLLKEPATLEEWQGLYASALISASNRKHPNRSKPRSSPRRAHPRRPKSTKFMKSERKKSIDTEELPPPTVSK
jgi:hypothetical protein